jgi:hypothetical protein
MQRIAASSSLESWSAMSLSPALVGSAGPAFEMKFLLAEDEVAEVVSWANQRLSLDPHGVARFGGAYRTISLYFDTRNLDVYHRAPWYCRHKFRIRRYESTATVFVERKSKWGDRVAKRRTALHEADLIALAGPPSEELRPVEWFQSTLAARDLAPACRITYERLAYVGTSERGPLRLTLDRNLHGTPCAEWSLAAIPDRLPLLHGKVILELKFRDALPTAFKTLVSDLRLTPTGVSKYRLCQEAWGVPSARRGAAHA